MSNLQMPYPGKTSNPFFDYSPPSYYYTYPQYTPPKVVKTVTVEKFYDEEGRLWKEVTVTTEEPVQPKSYTTTINNVAGVDEAKIAEEFAEKAKGKHRKK